MENNSKNYIHAETKNRSRGDNWTQEEKDLFIEIMRQSAPIIENKLTDTNTNKRKNLEWLKVQNKLKEITGKPRDITQLKGFWRRTKMAAKKSVSLHRRALQATGGGQRPASPLPDDLKIMELCPTDFILEENVYDSDAISQFTDQDSVAIDIDSEAHNSTIYDIEANEDADNSIIVEDTIVDNINDPNIEIVTKQTALNCISKKENKDSNVQVKKLKTKTKTENTKTRKADASHKNLILESNIELKEKSFKLLEEEYALKIKYQKQELSHQELRHKLEVDILLQEKEKKAIEISILKKKLL